MCAQTLIMTIGHSAKIIKIIAYLHFTILALGTHVQAIKFHFTHNVLHRKKYIISLGKWKKVNGFLLFIYCKNILHMGRLRTDSFQESRVCSWCVHQSSGFSSNFGGSTLSHPHSHLLPCDWQHPFLRWLCSFQRQTFLSAFMSLSSRRHLGILKKKSFAFLKLTLLLPIKYTCVWHLFSTF